MLQGLRTVIYNPGTDIEKAKNWYRDMLGFDPYFDEPFYVGFSVGGYELGLNPGAQPASSDSGVVAYWGVADMAKTHARLLELGAKPHSAIEDVGDGILVASVLDPFGNIVGIIENKHFKVTESA
jgi:predicted enzyme related to lactoylglutathione lyase